MTMFGVFAADRLLPRLQVLPKLTSIPILMGMKLQLK